MRSCLTSLTSTVIAVAGLVLALAPALGQQPVTIDLGEQRTDAPRSAELIARNANCPQPLDFRFHFQPGSWLQPAEGQDVLGVATGQSVPLPAVIDLRGYPPGRYQTHVEVSCLNCGVWVLQNCRFDRQLLEISVSAIAAPPPAPLPAVQLPPPAPASSAPPTTETPAETPTGALTPKADESLLEAADRTVLARARESAQATRAAASRAAELVLLTSSRRQGCEDELALLMAAAADAQAEADAATASAAEAATQASAATAAAEAASAAIAHREEAVQIQINYLNLILPQDGPGSQRVQNARQFIADAEAALDAARNAAADAQAAAEQAAADAQAAQAEADAAASAAAAANAAVSAKERECLGLAAEDAAAEQAAADAAAAEAAAEAARQEAEEAARGQAQQALEREIARCRQRCEDCREALLRLIIAQYNAMEALAQLGLLNPRSSQAAEQVTTWDQLGAAAGHMLSEGAAAAAGVPDMGAGLMLGALQAGYGLLDIYQSMMAPSGSTMGSAHVEDSQRLNWLQEQDFADNPVQAQAVLDEMANFMAYGRSLTNMNARLQRQRDACLRCEAELEALQARQSSYH